MRGLTAHNVLDLWEWSRFRSPANRALGFLSVACPETSWEQFEALSLGQRDARLLALREKTFGAQMQAFTQCQHCGERLEFAFSTQDVSAEQNTLEVDPSIEIDNVRIRCRLPTSADLIAVSVYADTKEAGDALLQRCLIEVFIEDKPVDKSSLGTELVSNVIEHIAQSDPQAEVRLNIHCPLCEQDGQALFDINAYLWDEFVDLAKRLMRQVSGLARGYGWAEVDILAMSAWRRQHYEDLLG